jgi:hypothetical protein
MKVTLLICIAAALAFSASAAARVLPGFNSPTGNIKCYYNPHGLTQRGFSPVVRCGLDHADYASRLQSSSTAPPAQAAIESPTARSSTAAPASSASSSAPPAPRASPASTGTATACSSRVSRTGSGRRLSRG